MIDLDTIHTEKILDWFDKNSTNITLDDNILVQIYKDVSYYGLICESESIADRISIMRKQISYIRKNILGILHRQNNNSANGIKSGYVYAIHNPVWDEYVKIGSSIDVYDRLNSYQTSSPLRDYEMIGYVFSHDRFALEREIHGKFERKNEWIKVDKNIIKRFLKDHERFPDALIEDFCVTEAVKRIGMNKDLIGKSDREKIKFMLRVLRHSFKIRYPKLFDSVDIDRKKSIYYKNNVWMCHGLPFKFTIVGDTVLTTI